MVTKFVNDKLISMFVEALSPGIISTNSVICVFQLTGGCVFI